MISKTIASLLGFGLAAACDLDQISCDSSGVLCCDLGSTCCGGGWPCCDEASDCHESKEIPGMWQCATTPAAPSWSFPVFLAGMVILCGLFYICWAKKFCCKPNDPERQPLTEADLVNTLQRFYGVYAPEKVSTATTVARKYRGNRALLNRLLKEKYNADLDSMV